MALINAPLPTLYEYYTSGGIFSGLSVDQPQFTLNNQNITIYSGAMHYFRIPKPYWRDRLRKLRASGLNTVETYVPWNLHEPQNGRFDFGAGGSDMEEFLDLREYLKTAQEEDLFAIVRPGPYICAEWEWGGLPSWLLREPGIKVRTSDSVYMDYVKRYFNMLLPILAMFQFTLGGPVIAFQVENEYGSSLDIDLGYIKDIYQLLRDNGLVELLLTSDGASSGTSGTLPDLLFQTVNFGSNPGAAFDQLVTMQPDKPVMAMEFWCGWFDHWTENHHIVTNDTFYDLYDRILSYPASVNIYMFHGGTNYGFLNGANVQSGDYQPTTTSYDYDAPISEAGDYTAKYDIVKQLIKQYNTIETLLPQEPEAAVRAVYPIVTIDSQLNFEDVIENIEAIESDMLLSMENLPINSDSGQSYGYLIYRKSGRIDIEANSYLVITGYIHDTIMVLINGELISPILTSSNDIDKFGYWRLENSSIVLSPEKPLLNATLDLVVENWGRVNFYNINNQYKGFTDENQIFLNGEELLNWIHFPLEFRKSFNTGLTGWSNFTAGRIGPTLYKGTLNISEPQDTFIDMRQWSKGIVIVNGFVLGRYALVGPQQTLYLAAPFLRDGANDIVIFEHFRGANEIQFVKDPIYKTQ